MISLIELLLLTSVLLPGKVQLAPCWQISLMATDGIVNFVLLAHLEAVTWAIVRRIFETFVSGKRVYLYGPILHMELTVNVTRRGRQLFTFEWTGSPASAFMALRTTSQKPEALWTSKPAVLVVDCLHDKLRSNTILYQEAL